MAEVCSNSQWQVKSSKVYTSKALDKIKRVPDRWQKWTRSPTLVELYALMKFHPALPRLYFLSAAARDGWKNSCRRPSRRLEPPPDLDLTTAAELTVRFEQIESEIQICIWSYKIPKQAGQCLHTATLSLYRDPEVTQFDLYVIISNSWVCIQTCCLISRLDLTLWVLTHDSQLLVLIIISKLSSKELELWVRRPTPLLKFEHNNLHLQFQTWIWDWYSNFCTR